MASRAKTRTIGKTFYLEKYLAIFINFTGAFYLKSYQQVYVLPRYDVIPKNSLLYTKFMALNELNKLTIKLYLINCI